MPRRKIIDARPLPFLLGNARCAWCGQTDRCVSHHVAATELGGSKFITLTCWRCKGQTLLGTHHQPED